MSRTKHGVQDSHDCQSREGACHKSLQESSHTHQTGLWQTLLSPGQVKWVLESRCEREWQLRPQHT